MIHKTIEDENVKNKNKEQLDEGRTNKKDNKDKYVRKQECFRDR